MSCPIFFDTVHFSKAGLKKRLHGLSLACPDLKPYLCLED